MKITLIAAFLLFWPVLSNSQTYEDIWNEGIVCFNEKNYHGVIQKMDQVIDFLPQYAHAYYNKGIAKLNLGDTEGACSDISKAVELGFDKNKKFYEYLCQAGYKLKLLKDQFYPHDELPEENGYRPVYTRKDTLRGALRPERTCFDVFYYDLSLRIIPKGKKISGQNSIWFEVTEPAKRIQIDLFDNFHVDQITWKNTPLTYKRECNALFIEFPEKLNTGEKHSISISYSGKPQKAENPPWHGGFVWKRDIRRNLWAGVACEHLGASSWWPNKDHLSDKPDSMKISLEVPAKYKAIANGTFEGVAATGKKLKKYVWNVNYPINNYNVTFYLGKFEHITDTVLLDNNKLVLNFHVLPHNLEKAQKHFQQTKDILKFYNSVFGSYPFMNDGFALVESPYEGMEHQTAIAYGHGYKNAEFDSCEGLDYDYIIVHEAAHEWWGNAVNAADMADIWIHEGFATYAELLYLEHRCGKKTYYDELNKKVQMIFNFWPMSENYNVNENGFAGNDVYNKGAMMLHCLRSNISNDSLFFEIIRNFNLEYRYRAIANNDFINYVNKKTGDNYFPFFNKYLYDKELPVLSYSFTNKYDSIILRYKWTGVEQGFRMPFCIKTNDKRAIRLVATTGEQEAVIENASWFNFYNEWQSTDGVADHSYTYFRTRMED
ncbi:MAG: M1 family metallopeptidase [Bacteroidales bacterium]|nr:M1 family metallopeptidase [Bacteroidales bacterium]